MLDGKTIGTLSVAVSLAMASVATPATARDMLYPDFESQWRNPTAGRGGNPWDPNKPMGLGQKAPLTAEYQAKFEASLKAQKEGGQGSSRGSTCEIAGMPKMMTFAEQMEIVIRQKVTFFIPMQ